MTLRLFNTLTKTKDVFAPLDPKNVRMYVCGPTVYDFAHIGNARPVIVFDVLFRLLRHIYGDAHVTYVRNITDVDDKINARAAERGISIRALTEETAQIYDEDVAALGNFAPSVAPRATDHIDDMIALIGQLIETGHAYAADGHVLFEVSSKPDYGKLSRRSLDEMIAGARVEVAPYKKNAMDFVLWKHSKAGEPAWPSPWGEGRPGWHIECSAMSSAILGRHFDIHGGGQDLQFPHHENEIAQSEGAYGNTFVNYWMHNGFIRVDDEKMSKSLGNFFTVREILAKYDAEVVRFFILRAHYRSPINYSDQHLDDARQALTRLYTALKAHDVSAGAIQWNNPHAARFREVMNDDFNTAEAVAVLFELANEANRDDSRDAAALLKSLGGILGLLQRDPTQFLQAAPGGDGWTPERIGAQIEARTAAKKAKNYGEADRLRKELLDAQIVLEDTPKGTIWRRA